MTRSPIERCVPRAGAMTPTELQQLGERSDAVLRDLGADIIDPTSAES